MATTLIRETKLPAFALSGALAAALLCQVIAQQATPALAKKQQKKADTLISKQEPPKVNPRVLNQAAAGNVSVAISLCKQRAYLMVGEEIAIDTPISSGKRAGMTPKGSYTVMEKDSNHRSSIYGNFINPKTGEIVRAGASTKIDSAPSGTVYSGAPMKWFMRLTGDGVGMHTGILPGYPASHGCVRLPEEIAKLFYDNVVVGTPVKVGD